MTAGHKHRHVKVRKGSLLHRVLTKPLRHTYSPKVADASRFVYGPCRLHPVPEPFACYHTSPLGILHPLTGLTLDVQ